MARILVIDDDADTRALLEEALKAADHEVVVAASGRDATERCRNSPPDLVITDLFMPEVDGLETIMELRTRWPALPIIAMTGRVEAWSTRASALQLGALEVVPKPFQIPDILAAVQRALAGGRRPRK